MCVCCPLFDVGCLLCGVCVLRVACCLMFVVLAVRCLSAGVVRCLMVVVCCLLFVFLCLALRCVLFDVR